MNPDVSHGPLIAGVDEAGRGALAGPVVAAACILPFRLVRRQRSRGWSPFLRKRHGDFLIADSKQLTPRERERAFEWIILHCPFGIGIVPHTFIEASGIRPATHEAMLRAIGNLSRTITPRLLRIDGRDHFPLPIPSAYIIRGDSTEPAIAAASIIAKVTRDRIMMKHNAMDPAYGFSRHKGYGTDMHCAAIRRNGPCCIHRVSFLSRILYAEPDPLFHATRGRKNHSATPHRKRSSV